MKHFFFLLFVTVQIAACTKEGPAGPIGEQGETGPQGPAGPKGPQGIAGNANVTQYTYGAQNLAAGFATLQVTTTLDSMNKSAWFVYLYYQPVDRWYFIPGYGTGGTTQYRVSMGYSNGKVNLYIDKAGAGENYANAKVVRIYTSGQLTGGRSAASSKSLPPIDFSDYEAVKRYYNFPD